MKHVPNIRDRWAVGWVQTGHEIAVASRLGREGAETYCPRYECVTRRGAHRRRSKTVKAGYPGYIFVDYESVVDEEQIRSTPKFRYFLRNEGKVSLLPDSVIEGFRALERQGIFLPTSVEAVVSRFIVGDHVQVLQGVFGGWRGFVREVIKGRVKVDGGEFRHPVEFADLQLAGDDVKAIAPNMGDLGDDASAQASGIIRIPARCVTRVVRLHEIARKGAVK